MNIGVPENLSWQQAREKRWSDFWSQRLFPVNSSCIVEDEVLTATRYWYVEGNLKPLLACKESAAKQEMMDFTTIMSLCPAVEVQVYLEFFRGYASYLSEKEIHFWGKKKKRRDRQFIRSFTSMYLSDHQDSTKNIYQYMLGYMLPDQDGNVKFPCSLGKDDWQPESSVSLSDKAIDVLSKLSRYLFGDDKSYYFSHIVVALPYVKYLREVDPEYFNRTLLEDIPSAIVLPPEPRVVSRSGQERIRAILGNLQGYKNCFNEYEGPLRHNDPEVEQQVRDILEELDMPEEYYKLLEFIHENKEDYVKLSL